MKAKLASVIVTAWAAALLLTAGGYAENVLMENSFLKVTPSADGNGVTLVSKKGGTSVDVVFVSAKGALQGKLGKAHLKLPDDKNFVEVSPGAPAVEVRMKARFSFIPDFHADDTFYDPTVCKLDLIYVPAENFFVNVTEGGTGGVILTWPRGGKQLPMLVAEGNGKERRFTKARVTAGGKSVFVAVMDDKAKLFPYRELEDKKFVYNKVIAPTRDYKYAEYKTGWKFPYKAAWWTTIAKPARNTVAGLPALVVVPEARQNRWGGWTDLLNSCKRLSVNMNGEWVLTLEDRFKPYYAALTYPKTRSGTPKQNYTVTDVLYETLGQKEVFDIINYAGFSGRRVGIPRGEPKIDATCAGWGGVPKTLKSRDKAKFMERQQACYNFCFYNKVRTNEYRKSAKEIIAVCEKAAAANPKLKFVSERLIKIAHIAEELLEEETEKFRKGVIQNRDRYWRFVTDEEAAKLELNAELFKQLQDYYIKVYNDWAEKDNAKAMSLISRSNWTTPGGLLDGIVDGERQIAGRIRQEAALVCVHSPEERELALKVREMAQKSLARPHMKEMPPSGRASASKEGR